MIPLLSTKAVGHSWEQGLCNLPLNSAHLHSGALAAQRTLVQLIQWLPSELCGMPNTTQVSGMGSVKIQKDGT